MLVEYPGNNLTDMVFISIVSQNKQGLHEWIGAWHQQKYYESQEMRHFPGAQNFFQFICKCWKTRNVK